MPTGVKELHPTCPEDLLTGKPLIENISFYIFFWTLSEEFLVLKLKTPAGLAKLHSVCPERFSTKNSFFAGKFSCKPFSDCRRQMIGRMEKNVKPVCQTCNLRVQMIVLMKKTFFAGIAIHFFELRFKMF